MGWFLLILLTVSSISKVLSRGTLGASHIREGRLRFLGGGGERWPSQIRQELSD